MSDFLSLDSLLDSLSDKQDCKLEKVASEENKTSVADELKTALTKEASDASTINGDNSMSVETGNAIADAVLAMLEGHGKQAAAGDPTIGNNVKKELDEMEAQHSERITLTPREGKTVTEVAKALASKTPGGEDAVVAVTSASTEGNSQAAKPSDIEKSAAVADLMVEGCGFEDAVELVKAASYEIEAEAFELEKAAAVNALISEGVDFESAIELVKEASEYMLGSEGEEYSDLEKAAAVNELMVEDGLSFDEASELVKEAAAGLGK